MRVHRSIVGVIIDGQDTYHAAGVLSDYYTLCGIDPNDSVIGHDGIIEPHRGQKITCALCRTIFKNTIALSLRSSNFESE